METYQSEALCARKKSHNHAHINALETTGVSTLFMAWTLACHCIQHKLKELWLHCLSGLLSKDLWWYGRHGWHHYACWHWGIWCKHLAGHWLLLHGFGWLMLGYLGHGCLWHGCLWHGCLWHGCLWHGCLCLQVGCLRPGCTLFWWCFGLHVPKWVLHQRLWAWCLLGHGGLLGWCLLGHGGLLGHWCLLGALLGHWCLLGALAGHWSVLGLWHFLG